VGEPAADSETCTSNNAAHTEDPFCTTLIHPATGRLRWYAEREGHYNKQKSQQHEEKGRKKKKKKKREAKTCSKAPKGANSNNARRGERERDLRGNADCEYRTEKEREGNGAQRKYGGSGGGGLRKGTDSIVVRAVQTKVMSSEASRLHTPGGPGDGLAYYRLQQRCEWGRGGRGLVAENIADEKRLIVETTRPFHSVVREEERNAPEVRAGREAPYALQCRSGRLLWVTDCVPLVQTKKIAYALKLPFIFRFVLP
jgi:hypothetical protein